MSNNNKANQTSHCSESLKHAGPNSKSELKTTTSGQTQLNSSKTKNLKKLKSGGVKKTTKARSNIKSVANPKPKASPLVITIKKIANEPLCAPVNQMDLAATRVTVNSSPSDALGTRDRSKSKKYNHDIDFDPSLFSKNDVAKHYTQLIRQTALHQMRGLPANIDIDDLISVGYNGLMDAYDKFDPKNGSKFSTYIRFRIEGAMLDELRSQDYLPRNVRTTIKQHAAVRDDLESSLGRLPTELEVADKLSLSLDDYQHALARNSVKLLRIEDLETSGSPSRDRRRDISGLVSDQKLRDPVADIADSRMRDKVNELVDRLLSERQRLILELSAFEHLSFKEVSKIIGVTDCRASQLHSSAVKKIAAHLRDAVRKENEIDDAEAVGRTEKSRRFENSFPRAS